MWIENNPSAGHGYSVIDEQHVCDWISQFVLVNDPDYVNINLDEPGRAYWLETMGQFDDEDFIRIAHAALPPKPDRFSYSHRFNETRGVIAQLTI